jgi:predicted 3-demethylubiquinone-9 3-methyltransferase (glyoxalase superfamily)
MTDAGPYPGRHGSAPPTACLVIGTDICDPISGNWGGAACMSEVSTCLWYGKDGENAVRFYVSLLPDSRIDHIQRAPAAWPGGDARDVILISFTLAGQNFQALNGGTPAEYGTAASISVRCADQAEVDRLWAALTAGGSEIRCGWLRDRWGVPWQIVPEILPRLLADPDPAVAERVFTAMTGMIKLDAAALERAAGV